MFLRTLNLYSLRFERNWDKGDSTLTFFFLDASLTLNRRTPSTLWSLEGQSFSKGRKQYPSLWSSVFDKLREQAIIFIWEFSQKVFFTCKDNIHLQFSSVQSLSHVWLCNHMDCRNPGLLSITNSWSLPKIMSIKSVMPSSHLILCHLFLLLPPIPPASESFPMSQLFAWGGQSIGVSALASFLPKKSQGWSPSEWTGWISL